MKHIPTFSIFYGTFKSKFGNVLVASTDKGVSNVVFFKNEKTAVKDLQKHWPKATITKKKHPVHELVKKHFSNSKTKAAIKLDLHGTDFQKRVWKALLTIREGTTTTYGKIAKRIGKPKAYRAVGTAIGNNPVCFIVPCHRVITSSGAIGGYRGGVELKKKLLAGEGVI